MTTADRRPPHGDLTTAELAGPLGFWALCRDAARQGRLEDLSAFESGGLVEELEDTLPDGPLPEVGVRARALLTAARLAMESRARLPELLAPVRAAVAGLTVPGAPTWSAPSEAITATDALALIRELCRFPPLDPGLVVLADLLADVAGSLRRGPSAVVLVPISRHRTGELAELALVERPGPPVLTADLTVAPFMRWDAEFEESLQQAWLAAGGPHQHRSVRWSLTGRRSGAPIDPVRGPSVGLGAAIALRQLFDGVLDVREAVVTGAVAADGSTRGLLSEPEGIGHYAAKLGATGGRTILVPAADLAALRAWTARNAPDAAVEGVDHIDDVQPRLASPLEPTDPDADSCPYRGLDRYTADDAEWFFGRDRLVAELVHRCGRDRLVGVLGSSGAGKSSLVHAGLVHALASDQLPGSSDWPVVTVTPGTDPLAAVASAVGAATADIDAIAAGVAAALADRHAASRFVLVIDQFEEAFTLADDATSAQLLGLLSTMVGDPGLGRLVVVPVVRADYYDRFASSASFGQQLNRHHLLVGPMSESELRAAITMPAQRRGVVIEPRLLRVILDDALAQPVLPLLSTALEQTWRQSGAGGSGQTANAVLTLAAYREVGGVAGALAKQAERVLNDAPPDEQAAIRRVLLRMVVDAGGAARAARRPTPLSELRGEPVREAALARLSRGRLVTIDEGTAEIAHESLLVEWPTLRGWLEADRPGRARYLSVVDRAPLWDAQGRSAHLLEREPGRLAAAQAWAADHDELTEPVERSFLAASAASQRRRARAARVLIGTLSVLLLLALLGGVLALNGRAAAQAALAEAERQRGIAIANEDRANAEADRATAAAAAADAEAQRALESEDAARASEQRAVEAAEQARTAEGQARTAEGAAVAAQQAAEQSEGRAVTALGERDIALGQTRDALAESEANADLARRNSEVSLSRALASQSNRLLGSRLDQALVLAAEAAQHHTSVATQSALLSAIDAQPGLAGWLEPNAKPTTSIAAAPALSVLVGADEGSGLTVWDTATGRVRGRWPTPSRVTDVVTTADGRVLAAEASGRVTVWDDPALRSGQPIADWPSRPDLIRVEVDHGGSRVLCTFIGAERSTLDIRDVTTGALLQTIGLDRSRSDGAITTAALSADGARVALALGSAVDLGSPITQVALWEPASGQITSLATPQGGRISTLTFTPDGGHVIIGDRSGGVELIPTAGGEPRLLTDHDNRVADLAVLADGTVLSSGYDGIIQATTYSETEVTHAEFVGHAGPVLGIVAGNDEEFFSAGEDGQLLRWRLHGTGGSSNAIAVQPGGPLATAVAASPDGQRFAAVSSSGELAIWSAVDGREVGRAPTFDAGLVSLAYRPDGALLAVGDERGRVHLVDAVTAQPLGRLDPAPEDAGRRAQQVSWHPAGRALAVGYASASALAVTDGAAVVWTDGPNGWQPQHLALSGGDAVVDVDFRPDGRQLAITHDRPFVDLFSTVDWKRTATHRFDLVSAIATAYRPDSAELSVVGLGSRVQTLDLRDGSAALLSANPGFSFIAGVAYSPDGSVLGLIGFRPAERYALQLIDRTSRMAMGGPRYDPRFTTDDSRPLGTPPAASVAFLPDGRVLVGRWAPAIELHAMHPSDLARLACARVGRSLTPSEWAQLIGDAAPYRATCG